MYQDIQATKKLLSKKCNFVVPITKYDYPIDKSIYIKKNNFINFTQKKISNKRSQDLKENYHDVGQFYWGKEDYFKLYKNIFLSKKVKGYFIPNYRARDIDTLEDLEITKIIFKSLKK